MFENANCSGMPLDYFFDLYEYDLGIANQVDETCWTCPVQQECLNFGIKTYFGKNQIKGTGVFGGIYIELGKFSRELNSHKSRQRVSQSHKMLEKARKNV